MNPKIIKIGKNYNTKNKSKRTVILPAGSYLNGKEVIGRTVISPKFKQTEPSISKEILLSDFKKYLPSIGFVKLKNNRWEKKTGNFLQIVFIEGSRWQKDDYDINIGTKMHSFDGHDQCYGDFHTRMQTRKTGLSKIHNELELFFKVWTDKKAIKKIIIKQENALKKLDDKYPKENINSYLEEKLWAERRCIYKKYNKFLFKTYPEVIKFVISSEFLQS